MMFFSHVRLGLYYYKALKKKNDYEFNIKPIAFIYGNIKPDITSVALIDHHFNKTYSLFIQKVDRVCNSVLSDKERSIALGEVMHFICDYFCRYHAKLPYMEASLLKHFLYELKLHFYISFNLFMLLWRTHDTLDNPLEISDQFLEDIDYIQSLEKIYETTLRARETDKCLFECNNKSLNDKCEDNFFGLVKSYYLKKESLKTDLTFTLFALNTVFKELLGQQVFDVREHTIKNESVYVDLDSEVSLLDGKVIA